MDSLCRLIASYIAQQKTGFYTLMINNYGCGAKRGTGNKYITSHGLIVGIAWLYMYRGRGLLKLTSITTTTYTICYHHNLIHNLPPPQSATTTTYTIWLQQQIMWRASVLTRTSPSAGLLPILVMTSPLCTVVPSEVSTQLCVSVPRGTESRCTIGVATPTPQTPGKIGSTLALD